MGELLGSRRIPLLAAITKADKVPRAGREERARAILADLDLGDDQCVITSARTKDGIGDLRASIDLLVDRRRGSGGSE
jgi:selenocysteine-specific translation elongation factor